MERRNFERIEQFKIRLTIEYADMESAAAKAASSPILCIEDEIAVGGFIIGDYNYTPSDTLVRLNQYSEPARCVYINGCLLPGNPVKARINATYSTNLLNQAAEIADDINDHGACPRCKIGRIHYKGGSVLECTECHH